MHVGAVFRAVVKGGRHAWGRCSMVNILPQDQQLESEGEYRRHSSPLRAEGKSQLTLRSIIRVKIIVKLQRLLYSRKLVSVLSGVHV